ncbi:hypothetical protein E2C01_086975 [Portunus trituberculatus]|uniref:Uncharacterized protein n=1 Tax=Portunus trituberculatus TaxID=210409 RepID=A0A5B7J6X9_PORTR|nr:hypothetical protein [Portunus trituberculatus]
MTQEGEGLTSVPASVLLLPGTRAAHGELICRAVSYFHFPLHQEYTFLFTFPLHLTPNPCPNTSHISTKPLHHPDTPSTSPPIPSIIPIPPSTPFSI